MARRSPRVVDTKERILTAALKLFGERGYYNVGVDEIAAAAGVTKGALYYYFTDAADLARDLARQLWDRLRSDARQAFDRDQDTITNLKRGFDAFLGRLQHTPEARFFLRDCRAIPELSIDGTEERAGSVALMRTMLEHGMARGEIVALDADALADVLGAACAEATLHVLATGRVDGAVQVIHRLIDSLAARRPRSGVRTGRRHGAPGRAPTGNAL
ncbi:MAG: Transcriptional regulator, TetR family [Deltaproteobacteria bacterium]|jgi:AcrR family transcriptional regulator|nr:Transcriptional regulator, TetR family [Deltaproteobacteria bacterium]